MTQTHSTSTEWHSRILREARLISWPWALMIAAGLFPLIRLFLRDLRSDLPESIAVLGFFGCAAVMTAISFRGSFLIVIPTTDADREAFRLKLWSDKMTALVAAVVCAGLLACVVQMILGNLVWRELTLSAIEPVLLLILIVSSTGFWTLLTKSITGGLILTGIAQLALYGLLVLFVTGINHIAPAAPGETPLSHVPEVHSALLWFVGWYGLAYAALMLWLGRRKFGGPAPKVSDASGKR